ncbi:RNA-binding S4 domain-containing protein [Porphyrobacter sp. ULC335]|jgi:ribosome-associated heat shock protein Hsp15|uniref:RNA-binding S4 domain-containing protein n=1 Tax=Porphyrobacter sp. ULC335 TaxID=2854260 RepID=UPI0022200A32|nr:RNA-binding S4 domain-containing protein [Porphyrobacter sp. ULC335]UYV16254.1 RNA-binding S4 domain-containing protein [Porphyrobacter sp. ULC335]
MTAEGAGQSLRIDRLLVYLRFARTRSAAQALIDTHALRRNRKHVLRGSEQARIGDVLTLALGTNVRVIELTALPDRRGSPAQAASHYREVDSDGLDRKGQMTIAASPSLADHPPDEPEDFL